MAMRQTAGIRNEVRTLTAIQIEAFQQPGPLSGSALRDYHKRAERIKLLWETIDSLNRLSEVGRLSRREIFQKLRPDEF